ncbi:hypothetical protein Tco_0608436 [Tanacetum coccineum]|uniref:Uncharacterized protein n=1 Tax=Tanacetum coccineum TaxID=301880 RepID=A0ABQ5C9E9_9ASTR
MTKSQRNVNFPNRNKTSLAIPFRKWQISRLASSRSFGWDKLGIIVRTIAKADCGYLEVGKNTLPSLIVGFHSHLRYDFANGGGQSFTLVKFPISFPSHLKLKDANSGLEEVIELD